MGFCEWANVNERNKVYHDSEWGIPVHDDRKRFEHLMLECMQCGLSWDLMLKKREVFRSCFDGFDFDKIAEYDGTDIERIMNTTSRMGRFLSVMDCRKRSAKTSKREDSNMLGISPFILTYKLAASSMITMRDASVSRE